MIPGLSLYLQKELDIPVYNVSEPTACAVRGLVRIMNDQS